MRCVVALGMWVCGEYDLILCVCVCWCAGYGAHIVHSCMYCIVFAQSVPEASMYSMTCLAHVTDHAMM